MSMAIKRASYTGDPGILDVFKKVAAVGASFIPGVGGQISQLISNLGVKGPTVAGPGSVPTGGGGRHPASAAEIAKFGRAEAVDRAMKGYPRFNGPAAPTMFPAMPSLAPNGARDPFRIGPITIPRPFLGDRPGPNGNGGAAMNGSMGGYHLNKSDYFLMSGEFVPAGTRWVKNRKRNPANARATSRAISRITGAKRYAGALSRISIRKKKC